MGPKNRATNWPYNRFGTISDGTITGMHCISVGRFACYRILAASGRGGQVPRGQVHATLPTDISSYKFWRVLPTRVLDESSSPTLKSRLTMPVSVSLLISWPTSSSNLRIRKFPGSVCIQFVLVGRLQENTLSRVEKGVIVVHSTGDSKFGWARSENDK